MEAIKINKKLTAQPGDIDLPEPGTTKLSFDATGPGEVEVQYSVADRRSVRFLENGQRKRILLDKAELSAIPKTVSKQVKFALPVKDDSSGEEPWNESLIVTVTVRKRAGDGSVLDSSRTTCICTCYENRTGEDKTGGGE